MAIDLQDVRARLQASRKALAVAVEEQARVEPPKSDKPAQASQEFYRAWSDHLGGPKIVEQRDALLEKYHDPSDARAIMEEWYNSDIGFVSEHMSIRDMRTGRMVSAAQAIDPYQIDMLENQARFAIMMKARRIGGSVGSCIVSVAAICRKDLPLSSFFVSRNYKEAKEKVEIAYDIFQTIPRAHKPAMSSRGIKSVLEFRLADGRPVKIHSHPQTEPRSIEGILWLDEFGAYQDQVGIYNAAIHAVSILGKVWLIGTPGNSRDLFSDIMENRGGPDNRGYASFNNNRFKIEWWKCIRMVRAGKFDEAQIKAPEMDTELRVERYGSEALLDIWNSRISDAYFQREEECAYSDDAESYYSEDLLRAAEVQIADKGFARTIDWADGRPKLSLFEQKLEEAHLDRTIFTSPDLLRAAIAADRLKGQFVLGIDPGFTDGCVLTIVEDIIDYPGLSIVRFQEKFRQRDFIELENKVLHIGQRIPLRQIAIDCRDREGAALASRLRANPNFGPARVKAIEATAQLNSDMAIDLHERLEGVLLGLPNDDDLTRDIKKVRRIVLNDGQPSISVKRDMDGHGDRFFSLIYALSCLPRVSSRKTLTMHGLSDYKRLNVPQTIVPYAPGPRQERNPYDPIVSPKLIVSRSPSISDLGRIRLPGAFRTNPFGRPERFR